MGRASVGLGCEGSYAALIQRSKDETPTKEMLLRHAVAAKWSLDPTKLSHPISSMQGAIVGPGTRTTLQVALGIETIAVEPRFRGLERAAMKRPDTRDFGMQTHEF